MLERVSGQLYLTAALPLGKGYNECSYNIKFSWHVARMGECRCVCRVLVEKPEGRRPLKKPRHRWEDNIKMDLRDVG